MKKIIENNQGGIVLFLGRVTNFIPQELSNFIEEQGLKYADKYEGQEIALLVLSSMLTPIEEQLSYDLYDIGVPDISLTNFEKYYTTYIKPNTLLMSLKLSNDQERIKRLLENEAFSDEVYLKLFKLYNWGGEGIHENNENRDVTISLVKRFFRPDGFRDPAMIYAPTTVTNVIQDTTDSKLLDAILTMPNHQIKVSRRDTSKPKNLRELVAFNESISRINIRYLLSFNNERINYFLASNSSIDEKQQEQVFATSTDEIKMMLTHNRGLSDSIYEKLFSASDEVISSLFSYQRIDKQRLTMILDRDISPSLQAYIGDNEGAIEVFDELLKLDNMDLDFRLASNSSVKESGLAQLHLKHGDGIAFELSKNINLSKEFMYKFYKLDNRKIIQNLAVNISTPKEILDELCQKDELELNKLLASNISVDIYYLRQFQLDNSLLMILAKNRTFGESLLKEKGF